MNVIVLIAIRLQLFYLKLGEKSRKKSNVFLLYKHHNDFFMRMGEFSCKIILKNRHIPGFFLGFFFYCGMKFDQDVYLTVRFTYSAMQNCARENSEKQKDEDKTINQLLVRKTSLN